MTFRLLLQSEFHPAAARRRRFGALPLAGLLLSVVVLLCGCAVSALDGVPSDPATPWTQPSETAASGAAVSETPHADDAASASRPVRDFAVAGAPETGVLTPTPDIESGKAYSLPELIDIAQIRNPVTRVAWQQARQAALASGMVAATYLPQISAVVIGGEQKFDNPLPLPIGNIDSVTTTVKGISPQIALQWLVFDFGERTALHEAARHNATAAAVLFNGMHQKIIFDVTRAYFLYGAARGRVGIAAQTVANSRRIEEAANARMQRGIGTTVEVAQAHQQTAQARFALVQAEGAERDAYLGLLGAMGVSPVTDLKVKVVNGRRLPDSVGAPTEKMIEAALARRPDVLATFSAMKASRSGIAAAEAAFLPKVFLGAVATGGNGGGLSAAGLPTIGQISSASGVMVGATMPIYDGGLRAAQLRNAESLAAASEATFQKTRDIAAREIVGAANALRSALAAHGAASALAAAAAVTYDAAFEAYQSGIGDITAATAAANGLLAARQAQSDAHAASLVSAANLAFMLGVMTSREVPAVLVNP